MRTQWIVVVIAGVCFVAGLGLSQWWDGRSSEATERAESLQDQVTELEEELATLERSNEQLEEKKTTLEEEKRAFELALKRLEEQLEVARVVPPSEPDSAVAAGATPAGPPVSFGEYATLEALLDADWATMAEAVEVMNGQLEELAAVIDAGETPDSALMVEVAKQNQKLVGFALELMGQLPTHASGNGEYTHPIALANMMAEVLDRTGVPLDDRQLYELAANGEDYEREWERINASYPEGTLKLEKLLDEVDLKQAFVDRTRAGLTLDQRDLLSPPGTRDRAGLDLFSPGLMLAASARPLMARSRDDLRSQMRSRTATLLGITEEQLAGHDAAFETWLRDVGGLLETPIKPAQSTTYAVDEALVAGRAQLRLAESLSASLQLSDEAREKLLESGAFFVPHLME